MKKNLNVYTSGDKNEVIYLVESGQIKLVMFSPEGKECLLSIYTQGDLFGESCLAGTGIRPETATAMEDTMLKGFHYRQLLMYLGSNSLYEEMVRYLANRLTEQQQAIADLLTADSEHRLGKALLLLGHKLGRRGAFSVRIEHRISHEELSHIVGTTRPRVSEFIQKFRSLGLIDISAERFLIIREKALADYLTQTP